jgi:hypothetical protein
MGGLVDELLKGGLIICKTIVMDAIFIKIYSKRDPQRASPLLIWSKMVFILFSSLWSFMDSFDKQILAC